MSEHDDLNGLETWDEVPEIEHDPVVPPDGTPRARPHLAPHVPEAVGPAVEAMPGLARVAAYAWWHTTEWGVKTSARAGRRMARAVVDPAAPQRRAVVWWGLLGVAALGLIVLLTRWNRLAEAAAGRATGEGEP